jgi:hypothetical protein
MSTATKAAIAPPKTPQRVGESAARASQAFELDAAADYQQPPLRATGRRARGALAIDVPRTPWLAGTPFPARAPRVAASLRRGDDEGGM